MAYQLGWLSNTNAFIDTFPSTLNPLASPYTVGSQQGGATGSGVKTTGGSPGICFGQDATATDWAVCLPNKVSTTKHYSEVTIKRTVGYTPPSSHEVEIHVGMTFNASHALSYEFDLWFAGSTLQPVRWEDPLGAFNTGVFTTISGGWPLVDIVDGDVIRVEFDSTSGSPVFTVKINGTQVWVLTDTSAGKYTSGSPGFAFFAQPGATMSSWCIKGYAAGSL